MSYRNNRGVEEKLNRLHFFYGPMRCALINKVRRETPLKSSLLCFFDTCIFRVEVQAQVSLCLTKHDAIKTCLLPH
jgi:hypothetical protein